MLAIGIFGSQPSNTKLTKSSFILGLNAAVPSAEFTIRNCWERSGWVEVFILRRKELIRMAKINGNTTYYRMLREAKERGFIV
jgi:hypothetical protein